MTVNPTFRLTCFLCLSVSMLSGCKNFNSTRIDGEAYFVDNYHDRNPVPGLLVETCFLDYDYDPNSGVRSPYTPLSFTYTDSSGFFSISTSYKNRGIGIDDGECAWVYVDSTKQDTVGIFRFQFPERSYSRVTIHLDTFALPHNVWIVPQIASIGSATSDTLIYWFNNIEVVPPYGESYQVIGNLEVGDKLAPVLCRMNIGTMHWLEYGSRRIARARYQNQGWQETGDLILPYGLRSVKGDTIIAHVHLD